jgi:DNA-binding transcriptional LysR family regulator
VTQSDPASLRYRDLPERKIEVAIGRIIGSIPDDTIDAEILYHEKVFVVAGSQSRWTGRRKIKLAELVNEPWTLPTPDSFARSLLEEAFRASGLPPPRVNSVSFSIPLHNALLASGNFLCVLPRSLMQFSVKLVSFKVLPVDLPVRPGPVGIITLKNRTPSPVAQLFIEHIRDVAKPLATGI